MTPPLIDANVLIAATVAEHVHHDRVLRWLSGADSVAVCPVVEGALLRFLVRTGESVSVAGAILAAVRRTPSVHFWTDDVSYLDADLADVRGHRQLTDAYLVALAASHDSRLATLDAGLAGTHAERALLIPG